MDPIQPKNEERQKNLSTAAIALLGAAVMVVATAAPGAALARIEGETGAVLDADCASDGETMQVWNHANGRVSLFFPEEGCRAQYLEPGLPYLITYAMSGAGDHYCFHWAFSGALVGSSPTRCGASGWYSDPVIVTPTQIGEGSFTVTWIVDAGPSWVNGFLDYLSVV